MLKVLVFIWYLPSIEGERLNVAELMPSNFEDVTISKPYEVLQSEIELKSTNSLISSRESGNIFIEDAHACYFCLSKFLPRRRPVFVCRYSPIDPPN